MNNSRLDGDPPIIVGGGGSTYIWVKRDLTGPDGSLQPIPNPDPQYPISPAARQDLLDHYFCYDIGVDLGSHKTHDGENDGSSHPIHERRKHWTRFFRPDSGHE